MPANTEPTKRQIQHQDVYEPPNRVALQIPDVYSLISFQLNNKRFNAKVSSAVQSYIYAAGRSQTCGLISRGVFKGWQTYPRGLPNPLLEGTSISTLPQQLGIKRAMEREDPGPPVPQGYSKWKANQRPLSIYSHAKMFCISMYSPVDELMERKASLVRHPDQAWKSEHIYIQGIVGYFNPGV